MSSRTSSSSCSSSSAAASDPVSGATVCSDGAGDSIPGAIACTRPAFGGSSKPDRRYPAGDTSQAVPPLMAITRSPSANGPARSG